MMGNLTDDMTRLRGEVEAMRGARGALMQDLTRGASDLAKVVAAMRADFASAHTAMAKKTSGEREAFVAAVILEVNSLLGAFSRERDDMARKGRHDRGAFLTEMRRQVTGMRKETADDLMGARLAWRGQSSRKSRPVQLKKEPEIVAPAPPPVEEARVEQEQEATPMTAMKETPVEVMEAKDAPVEVVEVTEVTAAPETPAVEPPKVKAPEPVVDSTAFQKSTAKSWLDEKPAKTVTKGKRGRK